ncbi:MAG: hypothetical protein KID00_10520 [Clostridium argentinense]|uniref:Uncharacterized protein n=1 Tax=Clostridium faecium TaxID=2762223 RepID=A0ABR8YXW8_9CLOT|nr:MULTISPECIES: hypothetical protein [Clostridium]MBD8048848.1 hypothetical protein [Clostridium faecium]MBS5824272.1 hypothetical protein [Clostridium argentinense]MDU1350832.1 hypothetical protein [Clostridium argentinense]
MKDEKEYNFKNRAKEMMIDGEDWDKIRKETKLREKDLRRIQKEISEKF